MKPRKYLLLLIISTLVLCFTGCSSGDKEVNEWKTSQINAIPTTQVELQDISQIARTIIHNTRGGQVKERNTKVLVKFKYGEMEVNKEFENNEIKITKSLGAGEKPYVSFKFIDIDKTYKLWCGTERLERGFYNIEIFLPKDCIIKEINGGVIPPQ